MKAGLFSAQTNALGTPLQVASDAALGGGSPWTIGAYFHATDDVALGRDLMPMVSKWGGSSSVNEWILYTTNSDRKLNVTACDGSVEFTIVSSTVLVVGTDYWCAASFDGASLRLWLNGIEEGSPIAASCHSGATPVSVGAVAAAFGGWVVTGVLGQVFKYPFALTASQLLAIRNGGHGQTVAEVLGLAGLSAPDLLLGFEDPSTPGRDSSSFARVLTASQSVGPTQVDGPAEAPPAPPTPTARKPFRFVPPRSRRR